MSRVEPLFCGGTALRLRRVKLAGLDRITALKAKLSEGENVHTRKARG